MPTKRQRAWRGGRIEPEGAGLVLGEAGESELFDAFELGALPSGAYALFGLAAVRQLTDPPPQVVVGE